MDINCGKSENIVNMEEDGTKDNIWACKGAIYMKNVVIHGGNEILLEPGI